jgi:hypothetical protein
LKVREFEIIEDPLSSKHTFPVSFEQQVQKLVIDRGHQPSRSKVSPTRATGCFDVLIDTNASFFTKHQTCGDVASVATGMSAQLIRR